MWMTCLFAGYLLVGQSSNQDRTIVIQESHGNKSETPQVFVEAGSQVISGAPRSNPKVAYRSWEEACRDWKRDLKQLNGKNLMVYDCGAPKREAEMLQSEKNYTYRSKATYKIRVSSSAK